MIERRQKRSEHPQKRDEGRLKTVHRWARRLNKAETMDAILNYTFDAIEQVFSFKHVGFAIRREGYLEFVAQRGYENLPQKKRKLPLDGKGLTVKAVQTGKTILASNVQEERAYIEYDSSIHSELVIPVRGREEIIGVLDVDSKKVDAFNGRDKLLMEILAAQVGMAIQHLRTEEKLRESMKKYRILVEMAFAGITITRSDETLQFVNDAFAEMLGYEKEELMGKKLSDLTTEEEFEKYKRMTRLREKGKRNLYESKLIKKNGSKIDVLIYGSPFMDEEGKVIGTIGVISDITKQKEVQQRLRENKEKYRVIVEQSHDGIFIFQDNRFLFVNDRICELTDYTKEELYNMNAWKLIHPQDRERIKEITEKSKGEGDSPRRFEGRIVTKDKTTKFGEFAISPIIYEGESAIFGMARDITERKKMEKKLKTLHRWARRLNKAETMDAILNYTLDAMEQTLGFKHAGIQLKRKNVLEVTATRGFHPLPTSLQRLPLDGQGLTVKVANTGEPVLVNDVTNHPKYLASSPSIQSELAVPIKTENQVIGVLNVESKERKGFNPQDLRLLETLASHVAVAIKELREKRKRISLQKLDTLRNQFLAMAAHEINTPLTPIKTRIEMVLEGYLGELTEGQEENMRHILESVQRLERLVRDFRRISKLHSRDISLKKEHHHLIDTVEKAISNFKSPIVEEGILLIKHFSDPLEAWYDEDRLIQVIRNLVENAIDYTNDRIWIKGRKGNEKVRLAIRDNGPGIPQEAQEKIFEPFYRVEKTRSRENRRYGGTGLGLNICKRIIKAHQGQINITSQLGQGTTVKIILPKRAE